MSKVLDISKHQGTMNFNKAKKAEIQGVMLRCAYGGGQDKKFTEFATNAQKCDMPIGAYAFATWHYDCVAKNVKYARAAAEHQATKVIEFLHNKNITGYVALDLELESGQSTSLSKSDMTAIANEYMDKLANAGYKPCLYCSVSWLYDCMIPNKVKYPLWIAYYNDAGFKSTKFPNTKYGDLMRKIKNKIVMWQYSSKGNGHNYGAGSKCIDLNHCYVDFTTTKPTPQPKPPVKTPSKNTSKYTVKKGDTLTAIAKSHGVLLSYLLRANPQIKNPNLIRVGQQIVIPHKNKNTSKTKYTVKKGDTLTAIAKANGVSLNNLIKANSQIKNPNIIHVGQAINIPLKNSAPKKKTSSIHVGSKVKIKRGAKTYKGGKIASFVYKNTYTVDQLKGNRAVLDLKGICTPVHVKDLEVV